VIPRMGPIQAREFHGPAGSPLYNSLNISEVPIAKSDTTITLWGVVTWNSIRSRIRLLVVNCRADDAYLSSIPGRLQAG